MRMTSTRRMKIIEGLPARWGSPLSKSIGPSWLQLIPRGRTLPVRTTTSRQRGDGARGKRDEARQGDHKAAEAKVKQTTCAPAEAMTLVKDTNPSEVRRSG